MLTIFRSLRKFFWPKDFGFRGPISGLRTDRCAERTLPNTFVTFVRFVVKDLFSFGCGFAALGSLWLNFFSF
jgi:hypothetical protein